MLADLKLLAFSSAKEGDVYWKREFIREKRLPTTIFSKSRWCVREKRLPTTNFSKSRWCVRAKSRRRFASERGGGN